MRATTRILPRTALIRRSRYQACDLNVHFHIQKDPVPPLQRACQCRAGDDQADSFAAEDDSAGSQEQLGPTKASKDELSDDESLAADAMQNKAELDRRAEFIEKYFQPSYDPMYHGKWVDIQGAEMKMPDYDFSEYDWMSRVPTDIGWPMFWEYVSSPGVSTSQSAQSALRQAGAAQTAKLRFRPGISMRIFANCRHFEELTATDDEHTEECETYTASGRLALHSNQKRARAFEAQTMLAGAPDFVAAGMEGTVKDEVPPATIVDRDRRDAEDPWELRARREKQEWRKERDYHWQVNQAMEHWQMLNHPPEDLTDVRIMEKVRAERYDWTDEEIWNVITNDGKSVDPFVMLHAPTFKTLNPLCMPDWASQGIEYVDDMEDWISKEGRWMSQAEFANVEAAHTYGEDDDEDIMAVEGSDEEDPLYEVSDIEGGEAGIEDDGEVSVPPEGLSDTEEGGSLGFA